MNTSLKHSSCPKQRVNKVLHFNMGGKKMWAFFHPLDVAFFLSFFPSWTFEGAAKNWIKIGKSKTKVHLPQSYWISLGSGNWTSVLDCMGWRGADFSWITGLRWDSNQSIFDLLWQSGWEMCIWMLGDITDGVAKTNLWSKERNKRGWKIIFI